MANMIDYLVWRGDLPFPAVPVGEVDGLILAQLAMINWEKAPEGEASLHDLSAAMAGGDVSSSFTADNDRKMLALAGATARFGAVRLSDYLNEVDTEAEKQFSAVTFHLPDGSRYISYRGTDATIVGWKEDCAMAFSKPVPAQEEAVSYLEAGALKYPGPLYVGGHSKGGNLAMFAAANANEDVRRRIVTVFNFDGPGLSDQMDAQGMYARMTGRLHSCIPQGSIVGLLLAHPDKYTVVKSNSVSLFQHDPYTWQVKGGSFVHMQSLSSESARFDGVFREWLKELDEDDRSALVDTLFGILSATKSRSFGRAFWAGLAQNSKSVLEAIEQVTPETRGRVMRMIGGLGRLALMPPDHKCQRQERRMLSDTDNAGSLMDS